MVPVVVAINRFTSDNDAEIAALTAISSAECTCCNTTVGRWGCRALDLADKVVTATQQPSHFTRLTLEIRLGHTDDGHDAENLRWAKVELSTKATRLKTFAKYGWDKLPVCMAKTQYSLTDDAHQPVRLRTLRFTSES